MGLPLFILVGEWEVRIGWRGTEGEAMPGPANIAENTNRVHLLWRWPREEDTVQQSWGDLTFPVGLKNTCLKIT